MEFKEFTNPEEKDYDINSSLEGSNTYNSSSFNQYSEELDNLIGILEDVTEEELQEQYGISMNEYLNPNADTITKVTEKLNSLQSGRHR